MEAAAWAGTREPPRRRGPRRLDPRRPSDPTRHLFGAKVAPDLLTLAEPALRRLGLLEGGHINAASLKFGNERSGNDEPNETPFLERRIG